MATTYITPPLPSFAPIVRRILSEPLIVTPPSGGGGSTSSNAGWVS